jgi:hypothetical protein
MRLRDLAYVAWAVLLSIPACAAGFIDDLVGGIDLAGCVNVCNDDLIVCGDETDVCFQSCQLEQDEVRDQCEVECTQDMLVCLEVWAECGEWCFAEVESQLQN